jgi:hypothetical protein
MLKRDYFDMAGGAILAVVGVAFTWHAAINYQIGSIGAMGPGMFPVVTGSLLVFFGLLSAVPAFFRAGERSEIRVIPLVFIIAGIAGFAICIRYFGLVPAVLFVSIVSSVADRKLRLLNLTVLPVALCLCCWLMLDILLGLSVPLLRLP